MNNIFDENKENKWWEKKIKIEAQKALCKKKNGVIFSFVFSEYKTRPLKN